MSERAPAPSAGDRDRGRGTEARPGRPARADREAAVTRGLGRTAVGGAERERKARDVGRAAVRDDRGR